MGKRATILVAMLKTQKLDKTVIFHTIPLIAGD